MYAVLVFLRYRLSSRYSSKLEQHSQPTGTRHFAHDAVNNPQIVYDDEFRPVLL